MGAYEKATTEGTIAELGCSELFGERVVVTAFEQLFSVFRAGMGKQRRRGDVPNGNGYEISRLTGNQGFIPDDGNIPIGFSGSLRVGSFGTPFN